MKITNRANLPEPFVRMAEEEYEIKPKRYSVTTLLKPVREILLNRRHNDEFEQDCSDKIFQIYGKAVHAVLENYSEGANEFAEEKLTVTLENGYTVSGIIDLYDIDKAEVADYKTASVWKVVYKDYDDWRKQGLMYAWLLEKNGIPCKSVVFYAILRDWSKTKAKTDSTYPQSAVLRVAFDIDIAEIDKYIRDKIDEIAFYEDKPDEELPLCSAEDRWNDGDKYAVMKNGRKTALRVLDSAEEAEKWKADNGGDFIEVRKGTDKKCVDYCQCCTKCQYWQERYGNDGRTD